MSQSAHVNNRPVGWGNMLAYGCGDLFAGLTGTTIGIWIFFFYTTVVGLDPIEAGSILGIARVWDAVTDPAMGYITDNTRSRFGRRRVYFLIGVPLVATFGLLWMDGFGYAYYLVTFLAFNTSFTLLQVPYETLAAEMTRDFIVRSRMTGTRMIFAQTGALIGSWLPAQMLQNFEAESQAFLVVGWVIAGLCMTPWLLVFAGTWETGYPTEKQGRPLGQEMHRLVIEMLSTFRLRIFRVHLFMYVGAFVALDVFNASFVHFLTFVMNLDKGDSGLLVTLLSVMQFVGTPVYAYLCMRNGNSRTYRVALTVALVGMGLWTMCSFGAVPFWLVVIATLTLGASRGGIYLVPWNIYNFIPDIDEILTRERREGVYAGVMTFMRKATQGAAIMLVGVLLQVSGFESGSEIQSPAAIDGLRLAFLLITALFLVFGFLNSFRFNLDKTSHGRIVEEIARLKAGGELEDVDGEARKTIEQLTGWNHAAIWGRNNMTYDSRTIRRQEIS